TGFADAVLDVVETASLGVAHLVDGLQYARVGWDVLVIGLKVLRAVHYEVFASIVEAFDKAIDYMDAKGRQFAVSFAQRFRGLYELVYGKERVAEVLDNAQKMNDFVNAGGKSDLAKGLREHTNQYWEQLKQDRADFWATWGDGISSAVDK